MPKTFLKNLPEIKILTDEPSNSPSKEFEEIAQTIAGIIYNSAPQFTIGVTGDWGLGKTTLMKAIRSHFQENDSDIQITKKASRGAMPKEFLKKKQEEKKSMLNLIGKRFNWFLDSKNTLTEIQNPVSVIVSKTEKKTRRRIQY